MRNNQIARTNIPIILFFLFTLGIEILLGEHFSKWIKPIIGILLIAAGVLNLTLLTQFILKIKFNLLEFLSISSALLLTFFPLLLTIEFTIQGRVSPWFSILNLFLIIITTTLLSTISKNKEFLKYPQLEKGGIKIFFKSNLFFYTLATFTLFLVLVLSYKTLPDLDPYSWLFKYETFYQENLLTNLWSRPLFSSLPYFFMSLTGLSLFTFFKYLLPFSFLLLLPLFGLISQKLPTKKHSDILWFLILSSPSTILYLVTPMPQLPFIVLMFYFSLTLLYSYLSKKSFFYYLAGFIMTVAFFYHQSAAIILLPWLLVTIISERKNLTKDKTKTFLIILLVISNSSIIFKIFGFIKNWTLLVYSNLRNLETNFLFPAHYTNIDGIKVGWSGIDGVTKFYAYYTGPVNLIGILILILLLITNKNFRKFLFKSILKSKELITILMILTIFLIISDFLPRIGNIALLPDRAWIYTGIFIMPLFVISSMFFEKINKKTILLFFMVFSIGISGAIYINYLKRYLITPDQLTSAKWIKENLPEKRLMISSGHRKLLFFHADSDFKAIPQNYFCQKDFSLFELKKFEPIKKENSTVEFKFLEYKKLLEKNLNKAKKDIEKNSNSENIFQNLLKNNLELIQEFYLTQQSTEADLDKQLKGIEDKTSKKITPNYNPIPLGKKDPRKHYIYFAQEDSRNPYIQRPYSVKAWGKQLCDTKDFIFYQYPEKFKEVYNNDNKVIIWEIL